ncbi:MAG: carbohydrate binding family 9 domain-containing protein, partial [Mucilaginibacter sp.]
VYAIEAKDNIVVDGRLNEESWKAAPVISDFFKLQPRQGGAYLYKTFVKIVYDKKNLYFGVFCKDTVGKKGVRVQDYRRDFTPDNDVFMIQLDPQNLKRFCVSFQATPLGTQSDKQVFDDQLQDINWDALWKVKTTVTDSGYYAEFAIPFKSLRYIKHGDDSVSWNLTFSRIARRDNEQTVFPAIPQTYSPYRMS